MIVQLRRWLPQRELIVVGDNSYAVLDLLHTCQRLPSPVTLITRVRLDAALYTPAPPYAGIGRPRLKGARLPTLQTLLHASDTVWTSLRLPWYNGQWRRMDIVSDTAVWYHTGKPPVPIACGRCPSSPGYAIRWVLIRDPEGGYDPLALLCTHQPYAPDQIAAWFVHRWCVEVTFQEARTREPSGRGLETQRQWSDLAILRTTPALLCLFSWVTLVAHHLSQTQAVPVQRAAWYTKQLPTFADALAWVRYLLWWQPDTFCMSPTRPDIVKLPKPFVDRLVNSLCWAT